MFIPIYLGKISHFDDHIFQMGGDYPPTRMVETTGSNATFGNFPKRCNLSHAGCSWVALNGGKGVTPVVMGDAPADCPRKILLEW